MGTRNGNGSGYDWGLYNEGGGFGCGATDRFDGNGGSNPIEGRDSWPYWVGVHGFAIPQIDQEGAGSSDWTY